MSWGAGALASLFVDRGDAAAEPDCDLHALAKTVDGLVHDMGVNLPQHPKR